MRIPAWRLALTGGAVIVLGVAGIGLAAAGSASSGPADHALLPAATGSPDATLVPERERARQQLGDRAARMARLLRLGRRIVHVEATVTDRDGQLVTIWLDHGTVQAAGGGSLTIAETGGNEAVKTDTATIVRVGREQGSLDDVKAGVEVFVQSRIVDGSALAKRILIIPAKPAN